MRVIIIIMVIFFVEKSLLKVQFYEEKMASSVRFRFFYEALHSYYEETRTVFVSARNAEFFGQFLPPVPLVLINNWNTLTKVMTEKTGTLVIILDGDAADQNFYDLKQLQNIRTNSPVLVICYNSAVCSSNMYLKKLSKLANSPSFRYAVIDERGSVQIFEHTTTTEGSCGVPRLVRLAYEDWVSWPNRDTFYGTLNFNKCPIRLATYYIASISRPCEPGGLNYFCGVEGEIVGIFVNKINATPVTTVVENYMDIKNFVATERADLGYGRLRIDSNKSLTYSIQYMYVKASIVVPHSASGTRPLLMTMALPLNPEVWIGFGVVLASMIVLCLIVSYFRRLNALQQFGLIIGISMPIQPQRYPQRIYFFSIVLFGFLISQAYLVNLTKIYSTSNPHHIKTLEELEELGLQVYGSSGGKDMLSEFGFTRILKNYKVLDIDVYISKMIKVATGQSSDPVYVEINLEAISSWKDFEFMEQLVRIYSVGLSVPNSSMLIKRINQVILVMSESGIMGKSSATKSTNNVTYSYSSIRSADAVGPNENHGPSKLSLKDLQDVFVLLIGSLAFSICCFLVELAVCFIKEKLVAKRRASIH